MTSSRLLRSPRLRRRFINILLVCHDAGGFSLMRAAALLSICLVNAPACRRVPASDDNTDPPISDIDRRNDTKENPEDTDEEGNTDIEIHRDSAYRSDTISDEDTADTHPALSTDTSTEPQRDCTALEIFDQTITMGDAIEARFPCFSGDILLNDLGEYWARSYLPRGYRAFTDCDDGEEITPVEAEVAAFAETQVICGPDQRPGLLSASGGDITAQGREMKDIWNGACAEVMNQYDRDAHFIVAFDQNGTVTDIVPWDGETVDPLKDALDCVKAALVGLTFPCFANRTVCADYVNIA